jgi:MoxR-like ATPase
MLEAMAERQVTVEGITRPLADPFFLMATENPIEFEGTFPLPEAQLDRFLVKTALGYPGADHEVRIVAEQRYGHPLGSLEPVIDLDDVRELHRAVQEVYVDELLQRWIVDLVRATREDDEVAVGCSVRGSLALERVARAWALLHGRDFVLPEDVELLFMPVLLHRINFRPSFLANARRVGWDQAVGEFKTRCLTAAPRPEPDEARTFAPVSSS